MDDRIIEAASIALGCSYAAAENFLESESGCYVSVDGESRWMSGRTFREALEALLSLT